MNHVGALDFIPSLDRAVPHRIVCTSLKAAGCWFSSSIAASRSTCSPSASSILADVLSTLCKQTNILDLSASCRLLYRKCKGAVVTTCPVCEPRGFSNKDAILASLAASSSSARLPRRPFALSPVGLSAGEGSSIGMHGIRRGVVSLPQRIGLGEKGFKGRIEQCLFSERFS